MDVIQLLCWLFTKTTNHLLWASSSFITRPTERLTTCSLSSLHFYSISALGEIVMYNKLDEHLMVSHAAWILTAAPEQLAARQGWHTLTTPQASIGNTFGLIDSSR